MTAAARIRTLSLPEKVTCVAQTPFLLLGGFQGGVYQEFLGRLCRIGQASAPVSFIALALPGKPQEEKGDASNLRTTMHGECRPGNAEPGTVSAFSSASAGLSLDDLLLGTWKGVVILRRMQLQVSEYPIKFIAQISEGMLAVSDSLRVHLVQIGKGVISSCHIGTYALDMRPWVCYSTKPIGRKGLTVITGYKLIEMEVVNGAITERKTTNIQEETRTTETITCLHRQPIEYLCGTIGGYLLHLEKEEEAESDTLGFGVRIEMERKLTQEKVCDILPLPLSSGVLYICITPTTFWVFSSSFQAVWQKCLTDAYGLLGVRRSRTSPLLFFVADTNCQVHTIDLEGFISSRAQHTVSEHPLSTPGDKATEKSHKEVYLELLEQINSGMI